MDGTGDSVAVSAVPVEESSGDGLVAIPNDGGDLRERRERRVPELCRVVLDESRARKVLGELAVGGNARTAVLVDRNRADPRRAGSDPDHPGLVRIYKSPDKPNDRYENAWHSDASWREQPPFGCVLRCVECPEVGGDTMWANMVLAYEKLPAHIKTQIANLRARHSIEATFGAAMPIEKRHALKAQFPDAEHPVVRTHPETG